MDSGSYQLAEKVIITITIVICPSGCVKAWGRFIVRLPPLRRQMRPSPVRSGSNRPSRSQASHFQSLPKAGLQTKYLQSNQMPNIDILLLSGFLTSHTEIYRAKFTEAKILRNEHLHIFNHEPKIFQKRFQIWRYLLWIYTFIESISFIIIWRGRFPLFLADWEMYCQSLLSALWHRGGEAGCDESNIYVFPRIERISP